MDATQEVKSRLAIEDVIGEYVQLKRAGRNYKGLSPFAPEKTPSFVVSPDKQIWHDFSSGRGGDVFTFVMEVEGFDFKAALEYLARKAGVDLDQFKGSSGRGGPNKDRLYDVLELAAKFYQVQFSKNKLSLNYVLKDRAFSKQTALQWRLGYSPNTGSALLDYIKSKGVSFDEAVQAGLITKRYDGYGDMFRGRLMIPLQDAQGRVIGFTARLLTPNDQAPKYINTPQTPLYDKSRHVYGLHLAKESIRKGGFSVLVEGNLDVIASHQAGVHQVVATAGTALTEPHLKTLSRFSGDIRLCFDADKAGVAATERAIPIASRVKVSLSIIDLPSGKDPDDLVRQDPKLWLAAINTHLYALDWLVKRYTVVSDVTTAKGKREMSDVLLPVVRALSDDVERDHYLNLIAATIGVSKEALDQKYDKTTSAVPAQRRRPIKFTPEQLDRQAVDNQRLQDNFMSLMLLRSTLREFLGLISVDMLYTDPAKELLLFLHKNPDFRGAAAPTNDAEAGDSSGRAADQLQNIASYVKIESLLYEELYQGLELNELHYEAARLQARLIENYVKKQKQSLSAQLETADDDKMRALLQEVKAYDALLKQVRTKK